MKSKTSKSKNKKTLYQWFGLIGDIVFVPFIVVILLSIFVIFMDRQQNKVPSLFGYSYVKILSNSMQKDYGFTRGDSVFIKQTQPSSLWVGDIIAFYTFYDSVDSSINKTTLNSFDQQIEINPNFKVEGRSSLKYGIEHSSKVTFHQIVEVKVDQGGTRFFVTKGTSNSSIDSSAGVREDFVIGKYVQSPTWLIGTFSWISSPVGMICLVCIPIFILLVLQSLSLIEQINLLMIEKQLLLGKLDCLGEDAKKLYSVSYLENISKIIVLGNNKEQVSNLLPLVLNKTKNKKQNEFNKKLITSLNLLTKNSQDYWNYWKISLKTRSQRKMLCKYAQNN